MTSLPDLSLQVTWPNARRACVTGANFSGFYTYEIAKLLKIKEMMGEDWESDLEN